MTKGIVIDVDSGKINKRNPKGWNKHSPLGAEDGAPNAIDGSAPAGAAPVAEAHRKPKDADPDIVSYAKGLSVVEIKAFLAKNSIEVDMNAPNGGVAKMRAMNAIRSAVKAGKVLVK